MPLPSLNRILAIQRRGLRTIRTRQGRSRMLRRTVALAGPTRLTRVNTVISTAGTATEQKFQILVAIEGTPGTSNQIQTGSQIVAIKMLLTDQVLPITGLWRFLLYKNPAANMITSATPIADYLASASPPALASQLIRQNALCFYERFTVSGDTRPFTIPISCYLRKLWRLGRVNYADEFVLAISQPVAVVHTFNRSSFAVSKQ